MSNPEWLDDANDFEEFDYDAINGSQNRKQVKRYTTSEDYQLKGSKRKQLLSDIRDLRQNFSIARWAIHKHVDFVTSHEFMPKTGDDKLDTVLREFVETASMAENFDISGRHDRRRWMRIAESSRLVDGDVFGLRVRGGYMQAIEADRVQNPPDQAGKKVNDGVPQNYNSWTNGIRVDDANRPKSYSIFSRDSDGMQMSWERNVKASAMIPLGFYDRFDQVRGISPWAAAANSMRDLYEAWDYALAKTKVAQLMALKITRDAEFGFADELDGSSDGQGTDVNGNPETTVSFDKGPQILDLDPGEDAAFLTAATPAGETAQFWQSLISVVLKSLNIPYSFYDESHTNYSGSRSSLLLYLRSVEAWRRDIRGFLNDWLMWRMKIGVLEGTLQLPNSFEINPKNWLWVAEGTNYWSPRDETKADIDAISAGLRTRTEVRQERFGDDWKTNVYDVLKVENELLADVLPELKALENDNAEEGDTNEKKKEEGQPNE